MMLLAGKAIPIMLENAALTMDESGAFYKIERFTAAGKLDSTEYWGFDGEQRVCKGVVVERGQALIN